MKKAAMLVSPPRACQVEPCRARPNRALSRHACQTLPRLAEPIQAPPGRACHAMPCSTGPRPASPRHTWPVRAAPTNVNSLRRASVGVNCREDYVVRGRKPVDPGLQVVSGDPSGLPEPFGAIEEDPGGRRPRQAPPRRPTGAALERKLLGDGRAQ